MGRPAPIRPAYTCPHCGGAMTSGGTAIGCAAGGKSVRLALPPSCRSRECQVERDQRAIEQAIARGVINP